MMKSCKCPVCNTEVYYEAKEEKSSAEDSVMYEAESGTMFVKDDSVAVCPNCGKIITSADR